VWPAPPDQEENGRRKPDVGWPVVVALVCAREGFAGLGVIYAFAVGRVAKRRSIETRFFFPSFFRHRVMSHNIDHPMNNVGSS